MKGAVTCFQPNTKSMLSTRRPTVAARTGDSIRNSFAAGVAELADALDLGSSGLKPVQVRFLSPALNDLSLK